MAKITTGTLQDFINGAGIGFDRIWDIADATNKMTGRAGYPPYNVVRVAEGIYRIEMAVAGFEESELNITVKPNALVVESTKSEKEGETVDYIHKGIATRDFRREFALADNVEVTDAELKNGVLSVYMKSIIPEANKPRTIKINTH